MLNGSAPLLMGSYMLHPSNMSCANRMGCFLLHNPANKQNPKTTKQNTNTLTEAKA